MGERDRETETYRQREREKERERKKEHTVRDDLYFEEHCGTGLFCTADVSGSCASGHKIFVDFVVKSSSSWPSGSLSKMRKITTRKAT